MEGALNIYQYLSATKPKTFALLSLIGLLLILNKIFKRLRSFYRIFLRPRRNLLKRYGEGSWVLVTGSSDGSCFLMKVLVNNLLCPLLNEDSMSFCLPEQNLS